MPKDLELLALRLVRSGLIRIDADPARNFVRYQNVALKMNLTFTYRQLFNKTLLEESKRRLTQGFKKSYRGKALLEKVQRTLQRLQKQCSNQLNASVEVEKRLARVLVQSTEPVIMQLLLLEKTELYITYGYDVGEMMDIPSWKKLGSSSGLQSTDGKNSAVFVSCGGNPFYISPEQHQYDTHGDGKPALSRLMIIAAQELGHYADLVRTGKGRKDARHSINPKEWGLTQNVFAGRQQDIKSVHNIQTLLTHKHFTHLLELEKQFHFYKKQQRKKRTTNVLKLKINKSWKKVRRILLQRQYPFAASFDHFETPGTYLVMMLEDMLNNITPKHEAYKREDKNEEEIIACIEALARVPQQALKWGHPATRATMGNLYKVYYGQVVPSCIKAYETLSKRRYIAPKKDKTLPMRKVMKKLYKKLPKKKPPK
jgi:hypothetical protein